MQDLLQHKEFFTTNKLRAYQYVTISKKPVMIRFNEEADKVCRLPDDVYKAVLNVVYSYYSLKKDFLRWLLPKADWFIDFSHSFEMTSVLQDV